MSQINFANLTIIRPDLSAVWNFLKVWIESHPNVRIVPIDRLAQADERIPAGKLAEALEELLQRGIVRELFRVRESDGTLLPDNYSSPQDVPAAVYDRFNEHLINTAETDIVPVYELPWAGHARS